MILTRYFEDRRQRKIDELREMYPVRVSQIETIASHNSDMDSLDIEEHILDSDPERGRFLNVSTQNGIIGLMSVGALGVILLKDYMRSNPFSVITATTAVIAPLAVGFCLSAYRFNAFIKRQKYFNERLAALPKKVGDCRNLLTSELEAKIL